MMHIQGRLLGGTDALSRLLGAVEENQVPHQTDLSPVLSEETCKEVRGMVLAIIRETADRSLTRPDPELDCEEYLLASLESGVRSITWERVKKELLTDTDFQSLATWIIEGCREDKQTPSEIIKKYGKFRSNAR